MVTVSPPTWRRDAPGRSRSTSPTCDLKRSIVPSMVLGRLESRPPRNQKTTNQDEQRESYSVEFEDRREQVESNHERQDSYKLADLKSSPQCLILPPPSTRRRKGIFGRRKVQKIALRSSEPLHHERSVAQNQSKKQEAVETILLSWTKYQLTVKVTDGENKVINSSRLTQANKAKPPRKATRKTDVVQRSAVSFQPLLKDKEKNEARDDASEGFFSEKSKGLLSFIFGDAVDDIEDDFDHDETNDSTSSGPNDIPHEISYRTLPSIPYEKQESHHSTSLAEIPAAVSIAAVSDVSSSSSEGSWSSSDDDTSDESSHGPHESGFMQMAVNGNWTKKLIPVMRQLSRPVVKASSPVVNVLK